MIHKVTADDDFRLLASLLNRSFLTVAEEFSLTKENCPTNNGFISTQELKAQLTENREFYYKEEKGVEAGFIAIERSQRNPAVFYIEKVAVLPEFRHQGTGKELMDFATNRILELQGKAISIGIINSNTGLKEWYEKQGFTVCEIKSYAHLPFEVCLMEKQLNSDFPAASKRAETRMDSSENNSNL